MMIPKKESKPDKSIKALMDIKENTSDMRNGIENLNLKFDAYLTEQREHNKQLGKIYKKIEKRK